MTVTRSRGPDPCGSCLPAPTRARHGAIAADLRARSESARAGPGPVPKSRSVGGEVLVLTEEVSELPEQSLDTRQVQPVVPARCLCYGLMRRGAAPVLKVCPSAAEDDESPSCS